MQLCQLNAKLKSVILSEILLEHLKILKESPNCAFLLDFKIEQHICDNYKSKFEKFEVIHNKKELAIINIEFVSIK